MRIVVWRAMLWGRGRKCKALAARFVDFTRDMNMQRRADLQMISRGMTNYESEVLRQRQMLNNVIRISSTPQQ